MEIKTFNQFLNEIAIVSKEIKKDEEKQDAEKPSEETTDDTKETTDKEETTDTKESSKNQLSEKMCESINACMEMLKEEAIQWHKDDNDEHTIDSCCEECDSYVKESIEKIKKTVSESLYD